MRNTGSYDLIFAFEGKVKTYLRINDNNNIHANDKWVNLHAMFSPVSEKFIQFRLFKKHLNIAVQMVPYFVFHSCKMFLKEKPLGFS